MDASKVNVLPKVEEPTVSKKQVEYATTFFPATSVPAAYQRVHRQRNAAIRYSGICIRLGYGNQGNLDVLANYLFRFSKTRPAERPLPDGRHGRKTGTSFR